MNLKEGSALFATPASIDKVSALIKDRKTRRFTITGLRGSALSVMLSRVPGGKHPAVIVADDADDAGYIYHDLTQICGEGAFVFPSGYKRGIRFGQTDPPAQILRTETLEACASSRPPRWIVTYPEALAEKVPNPGKVAENTISLKVSDRIIVGDLLTRLRDLGFKETDYVYEPGQFARRGSIIDVFSFSRELPFRIDLFDDEIDTIRTFNIETQLSESKLDEVKILPSSTGVESMSGISLTEYLGKDCAIYCRDFTRLIGCINEIAGEQLSESALLSGEYDEKAMQNVVEPEAFMNALGDMCQISLTSDPENADKSCPIVAFYTSPQLLYHKNFDIIAESFSSFEQKGYRILLLSDSAYQAERLRSIFEDRGDSILFTPIDMTLHEGFVDHDSKTCFFTDHQIFDRYHKFTLRSDRARSGKLALSLKELSQIEPGDYIVHIDHGIGKFAGLVKTQTNGHPQEMIKLIYMNDDIILVSIHALHKLSKYRGKEGIPPKINKLGTGAWERIKQRTKAKVKDIARDLIKLYATRREEKGYQFSPDSYLQNELEAGFIYEETPDQLKAMEAVKKDMESPKPMDRLVCGDVGFGKTEIAIRAAFKAAADSKQTAVLVPTTVLAMQHYHTFSQRLKDLPVRVDFISRARTPKQVKQILEDLEAGKIDILIGTHKLIGKGVKFKDLGLLIIDEEQKFGVAVKEKLKQMKVNVDTLTMSATPIPRTLQFSLMGARDLSSLNTPPANRHPIVTNVTTMDDDVIREAVNFELSRNGQVFFVSNRIENLTELETKLKRLVPGVRVVTAHGQMPPEKLEKAIMDFSAHDYDVLLSTTIVENGIDMPNVNTILINNAHNFGLSELHQLRGRVGRSNRKAFCYLIVPPGAHLSPEARRRLQAIESFSDLGSGIHIAMQDLDIRGAGNLLGAEQSGFIADLGYETYQKILRESVIELKTEEFGDTFTDFNDGKEEEFTSDCTIESDLELRIPPSYVPQESERISLYQELDNMENKEQTEEYRARLRDRFGAIPEVTEELIKVVLLRLDAKRLGIERLVLKDGVMRLYFVSDENVAYYNSSAFGRVLSYMASHPKECQLRENKGIRSMIVSNVTSVSEALDILNHILTSTPL